MKLHFCSLNGLISIRGAYFNIVILLFRLKINISLSLKFSKCCAYVVKLVKFLHLQYVELSGPLYIWPLPMHLFTDSFSNMDKGGCISDCVCAWMKLLNCHFIVSYTAICKACYISKQPPKLLFRPSKAVQYLIENGGILFLMNSTFHL